MKNLFNTLLKEAAEETIKEKEPTEEEPKEPTEEELPELPEELPELPEEEGAGEVQKALQNLIMSVLDAIEQEALAAGETFEEDESVDVGLELLYKLAPKLSDEDAQMLMDELQEYYEMEVDEEGEGEDEEYFEEPPTDDENEYQEDKEEVKTEGVKKKF